MRARSLKRAAALAVAGLAIAVGLAALRQCADAPGAAMKPVDAAGTNAGTAGRQAIDSKARTGPRAATPGDTDGPERSASAPGGAAACRLAMQLVACRQYALERDSFEQSERSPPTLPATDEAARRYAEYREEMQKRLARQRPLCESVASPEPAWRLLLDAALAGHAPSMALFAQGTAVMASGGRGEWDLEAMGAYRDHVYEFLVRAAEYGDAGSIRALAEGLIRPGPGPRTIPHDPARGLAYALALLRHSPREQRAKMQEGLERRIAQVPVGPIDRARAEVMSYSILPASAEARLDAAGQAGPAAAGPARCEG